MRRTLPARRSAGGDSPSLASIFTSLIDAKRFAISPLGSNSQFSLPYERHHWPCSSWLSYSKRTAMRFSENAHSDFLSR